MSPDHLFGKLIAQATALTRRGNLAEATQAIQRALHLGRESLPAAPPPAGDAIVLDGLVREVDTPPPTVPTQPASFDEYPFATAQGLRHYKLFIPAGLGDRRAPLVVMLHGCSQNPDDFAAGTRMNEFAQQRGFRVLYPAQAQRSNAYKCWNWFRPGDQRRDAGEPAMLAGMTRQVMQTHAVDADRIYVAGLSAGGAMAAILAHEYPDVFAAAGVHSGLAQGAASDVASAFTVMKQGPHALPAEAAASPVPMIVFHGDQDSTVHPRNGEHLVAGQAASDVSQGESAAGRSFVRTSYRDTSGRLMAEHWLVHGAGHAWSGGSPAGSYTDAQGPDATREMLRFFAQHRRA
ncbi:MAG: PHB depolymerase family esterase [Rhizobacter sp.]